MAGAAIAAVLSTTAAAQATQTNFTIAGGDLRTALADYARQSGVEIFYQTRTVAGRRTAGLTGAYEPRAALEQLVAGAGLVVAMDQSGALMVREPADPQGASAAGGGAEVEALIVTAQKREEDIQDVPIAISAFSQEALERSQVAGGPDLMTQVPNMTFTKTNFSSYSIQIRGIGTQAISATVDPAVAVAFNNTPFIRNRFFEQEFYDLQRVEVLRGPQGTLYGRNATAGVVNLISQKARLGAYEAKVSGDIANYNTTRVEGMLNIPLAEDVAALRIAGAWTKREGYSINEFDGEAIDGRDLWSTRVSLRFAPTDRLEANLIWEHFEEDDDRMRSGKQLCQTHEVTEVAGIPTTFYQKLPEMGQSSIFAGVQGSFSQGCLPASLYSPDSFGKPNALALPYYTPLGAVALPIAPADPGGDPRVRPADPYASRTQSSDLRIIEATVEPSYRAKTDIAELQVQFDITDDLTLASETAWSSDFVFGTQDYNRFIGAPHAWNTDPTGFAIQSYLNRGILSPEGVFCDPQIGCSDRLVAMDLATSRSTQFSQELRLASDYDGPFNFSLGGNFLRHDAEDKYYVFINSLTLLSAYQVGDASANQTKPWLPGVTDNRDCLPYGLSPPDFTKVQPILQCTYIDPNPINNLNDLGHNYFLSKNPYKLISYAVFGEAYYNIAENLKVTAGLRWTVDKKEAPLIPSWVFAANSAGHPIVEVVEQEWRKPTGRLALDWKPVLSFTDETMVYASYSHGYKAGGMNPPPYGKASYITFGEYGQNLAGSSALHPKTFEPEYVDAFELGSKNTLLDGALTLNVAAFYYDYQAYQLSQIVNRSAVTANFDADIWGIELESDWRPAENLRLGLKLGYENTKVGDGMQAIDVMDRTAGNDAWVISKPFPAVPSNCVLPTWLFLGNSPFLPGNPDLVNVGGKGGGGAGGCELAYLVNTDPGTNQPFVVNPFSPPGLQLGEEFRTNINYAAWSTDLADYPCWPNDPVTGQPLTIGTRTYPGVDPACLAALSNNGEGFFKDLSGNELPNAPNLTATLTADYTIPLPQDWLMTLHTDLYYQSEAWTRIFNTEGYDKLKAYTNVNLAAIFTNEEAGWKVMAYVKNIFDRDSITGAFLNSDDTGLTTNIFLTEPRLYGLRVTKEWNGGPWWTGGNLNHEGPYPLTVELSGQVQRQDARNEELTTAWAQALPDNINPGNIQDRNLDWGDGRSVKLTWRPEGSPWSVSGALRYGRTNTELTRVIQSSTDVREVCGFTGYSGEYICSPDKPWYLPFWHLETVSWSDAESRSREEHQFVDFSVGYDMGVGGLASTISAGLRHAEFQSDTAWLANTQSGWDLPVGWADGVASSYFRRHAALAATREFSGSGPVVSWDASAGVWDGAELGKVRIEWSVGGGVLLGKHETSIVGQDQGVQHTGHISWGVENFPFSETSYVLNPLPAVSTTTTPVGISRSENATVPLVDLSLGLSYEVGRVKVGAGYRWERYFDVLDVGFEEGKDADRTIDGPYFKIAVGFGG